MSLVLDELIAVFGDGPPLTPRTPGTPAEAAARLSLIGSTFVGGLMAGLSSDGAELGRRLDDVEMELRGFAYEGAGMALAARDLVDPAHRLRDFAAGPGERFVPLLAIGAGWAAARLGADPAALAAELEPAATPLILDGFGFYEAFFHPRRHVDRAASHPAIAAGDGQRAFDRGAGRALGFLEGGRPQLVASRIAGFPAERQRDLWQGAGFAAAYAGGAQPQTLAELRRLAGRPLKMARAGARAAADFRERAGNPSAHTAAAVAALG